MVGFREDWKQKGPLALKEKQIFNKPREREGMPGRRKSKSLEITPFRKVLCEQRV